MVVLAIFAGWVVGVTLGLTAERFRRQGNEVGRWIMTAMLLASAAAFWLWRENSPVAWAISQCWLAYALTNGWALYRRISSRAAA